MPATRQRWILPLLCLTAAASAFGVWAAWPLAPLEPPGPAPKPAAEVIGGQWVVRSPGDALLAEVGTWRDELLAYLRFEYLRSLPDVDQSRVLLTARYPTGAPEYYVFLEVDRDLLAAVPYLAGLQARGYFQEFRLAPVERRALNNLRQQTKVFISAYNMPVRWKLESLNPSMLRSSLARFILFKSKTDRRVRERIEPVPSTLSTEDAGHLASDIMIVARFYGIPLDLFLGIGAMENNYMDMMGDREHSVWKRRAQKGDIVLERRRGRVRVHNYSVGIWQITRETLRHAHKLYLKDDRDYTALPEHLRPSRELDLNAEKPQVLTTYAGLLFRYLLDYFEGDVGKAVGAYNGGKRNPNDRYAGGVRYVAEYSRKILEQVAMLNGRAVAETTFIRAR
ncbi:MAG: hypothetical protein WD696_16870 [Bryobacteraceae bacterium]